jgi:hypothetical protein
MIGGSGTASGAEKTIALKLAISIKDNKKEINMGMVRCQLTNCFDVGWEVEFITETLSYISQNV